MEEIWKDIEGWNGLYQVSNTGLVKSISRVLQRSDGKPHKITGKTIIGTPNHKGYLMVGMMFFKKRKTETIHRLVAMAFIPNPLNLPQINHKDGNKQNNNDWNLEWVTNRENVTHSFIDKKKASIYTGVYARPYKKRKWKSVIKIDGKEKHLGTFETENEARDAYQKALIDFGVSNKYVKAA